MHAPSPLGPCLAALLALPACRAAPGPPARSAQVSASARIEVREEPVHEERVRVHHADVKQVASRMQSMIEADPASDRGPIRSVAADEQAGEVIVMGTERGILAVRRFLAHACDPPRPEGEGILVIPLIHAAAADVARAVAPLAGPGARVVADVPTNSVIVQGPVAARERVRRAVAAVDTE